MYPGGSSLDGSLDNSCNQALKLNRLPVGIRNQAWLAGVVSANVGNGHNTEAWSCPDGFIWGNRWICKSRLRDDTISDMVFFLGRRRYRRTQA